MYIWVAIDVNEQMKEIRKKAEDYDIAHGLKSSVFTLPYHISLKISFQIPNSKFDEVVSDIKHIYQTLKPFTIMTKEIQCVDSIIWIKMQENKQLNDIHNQLDEMLFAKYGVRQHEYDKDFIFHTTILMLDNKAQIGMAFEKVKDSVIPETLQAETFIIGYSNDGTLGTYQVKEQIQTKS